MPGFCPCDSAKVIETSPFKVGTANTIAWLKGPTSNENEPFPSNAYPACFMENGDVAYVARGKVEQWMVNGYTTRSGLQACIPYADVEHWVGDYEIMVTDTPEKLYWQKAANGEHPENAVKAGMDGGTTTYIGRSCTPYKDVYYRSQPSGLPVRCIPIASRLGKIDPRYGCLYVAYQGTEYNFTEYEVLCSK